MTKGLSIFENRYVKRVASGEFLAVSDIAFCTFFFSKMFSSWPPELHALDLAVQALSAIVLAVAILSKKSSAASLLVLYGVCFLLTAHNIIFVGTEDLESFVQLCVAATAGCYLFYNGLPKRFTRIVFWATVLIICILMVFSVDGYFLFPYVLSRNYASVFMLMAYICLTASREPLPELEMLASAIACFLTAIFCVGRGGILATALLVLCCLVAFLRRFPSRIRRTASITLAIVGALAFAYLALVMGDNFLARFSPDPTTNTSDAHRLSMLNSYFRYTFNDPRHLLFGFNPLDTHNGQIMNHDGNVHNSFLQFHASFGLVPFVLLVASVIQSVKSTFAEKKRYLTAALVAFFARALLGRVFPFSYADFILFFAFALLCERIFSSRQEFDRDAEEHAPQVAERHAYTACTPLQLFVAIEVRNQADPTAAVPADLYIFDEFKDARFAAETMERSPLFERVFLMPSNEPTGSLPIVKTYFEQVFFENRCRKAFEKAYPMGDTTYTEFFCANPRTIIDLKRFAADPDARVNLFFEGTGSYAGTIASYFTIKNSAVSQSHRSRLPKQVVKQDLKGILECLDSHGFFYSPAAMYIINDLPELHEMYPEMELVPTHFDTAPVSSLGGYFEIDRPGLYGGKLFFLGTYDSLISSEEQLGYAVEAARILDKRAVFRAHPHCPIEGEQDELLTVDDTGNLWELICCNGLIAQDAVLVGFTSTAQFLPKQLMDEEPYIVLLHRLAEPGIIRDRLEVAASQIEGMYRDRSRVFMPETAEEYRACLQQIKAALGEGDA